MQDDHKKRLGAALVAILILVALAFITMPELRVLLLLIDYLGLELIVLLLATQLRILVYLLFPAANSAGRAICTLAFRVGRGAMRTVPKTFYWHPFDKLLSPAFVFVTYGVRCGTSLES